MRLVEVYNVEKFRELVNSDKLTVIYFCAVWCGPCKTMEREVEKLTYEFPKVQFAKVDADNNNEIVTKCRVMQLPTFMIVKSGKLEGYVIGADANEIRNKIRSLM